MYVRFPDRQEATNPFNDMPCALARLVAVVAVTLVTAAVAHAQIARSPGLRFEENRGQVVDAEHRSRPDILFKASASGVGLYLRRTGISYVFASAETTAARNDLFDPASWRSTLAGSVPAMTTYRIDAELIGANPSARVTTSQASDDYTNYYLAHCPRGITNVRSFGRVIYHDIYPNIDLVFRGTDSGMKYDFVVHPGGRTADIRIRYMGGMVEAQPGTGGLSIYGPLGRVDEGRPLALQASGGDRSADTVAGCSFHLEARDVTFRVGAFDPHRDLVIDPAVAWSTFFGGNGLDRVYSATSVVGGGTLNLRFSGSSCVAGPDSLLTICGYAESVDFPITPGVAQTVRAGVGITSDCFVARCTMRGTRLWATYLGGSQIEQGGSVAVDRLRNTTLVARTESPDYPVTPGAFNPTLVGADGAGLVSRLDPNGRLLWSTYFNGVVLTTVACLGSGDLIVGGQATSAMQATAGAFQTLPPAPQRATGMLARFSITGTRQWATFLGGTPTDDNLGDGVADVSIGSGDTIAVCGIVVTADFPASAAAFQRTISGFEDAFVGRFDADGRRDWLTLYGGSQNEYACGVAFDSVGSVVICGYSDSPDFPVSNGAYQGVRRGSSDGFVARFDRTGARQFATLAGGAGPDMASSPAIAPNGDIWLASWSSGGIDIVTPDAFQPQAGGSLDAGLIKFDTAGALLFASNLGGSLLEYPSGSAATQYGCVVFGWTSSPDFPTTANAFQRTLRGSSSPFLTMICDAHPVVELRGPARICQGDSVQLAAPAGFDSYLWSNGATTRTIVVRQSGTYSVTVSHSGCSAVSNPVPVVVLTPPARRIQVRGQLRMCQGDTVGLSVDAGLARYRWNTGDTTRAITVRQAGTYSVWFVDSNGCSGQSDTVAVAVRAAPEPTLSISGPLSFCEGERITLRVDGTFDRYSWNTGDTTQSITVSKAGVYSVLVRNDSGCWSLKPVAVVVRVFPRPNVTIRNLLPTTFCEGDSTILIASGNRFAAYSWSNGATTPGITVRTAGRYQLTVTDTNGCSASAAIDVQVGPRPKPVIAANGPVEFCAGDSVVLSANGFSSWAWSNGSRDASIVVRASGRYFVTVTNDQGCTGSSDTVTVVVRARPSVAVSGPVRVCHDAEAAYSVPAVAGRTYEWSVLAGGLLSGAGDASNVAVQWGGLGTGRLRLRVVDESTGCSNDTTITVTIGASLTPLVTASRPLTLCDGDSVTLYAGSYVSYSWSTGATTPSITVNTPGIYTVAVVDAKGCSGSSDPVVVTQAPSPVPTITMSNGGVMCEGDSVVLDAGAGYATYLWSNGYSTRRITSRASGVYTVTVTDTNGCTGTSAPAEVRVIALPQPGMSGPVQVCQNSTVEYSVPAIGGAAYTWSVTGGAIVGGQGTSTARVQWGGKGSGRVDVSVTTSEGCTGKSPGLDVEIGDHLLPTVTPSGPVALCPGGKVTLDAGSGYTTYHWSTGESTRTIEVSAGGSYTVTVSDAGGCSGTSVPVIVEDRPSPVPVITSQGPVEFCEGDSVVLVADAGYTSYTWSSGERIDRITVKQSGTYTVTVTNTDGCTGTSSATGVVVHALPAKPLVTLSGNVVSTASAASAYQWLLDDAPIAGGSQSSYAASVAGYYRVRISDGFGCTSTSDAVYYRPAANARLVWLDTVSARVGDRVQMVMRVSPALVESDSVHGYRADIQYKASSLFLHGVHSPDGGPTGDAATLTVSPGGVARVERSVRSGVLVGDELFRLDLEGLVSGQPLNEVVIAGISLATPGPTRIGGAGLLILSGCEIGTAFGKRSRLDVVKPNPARESIVVRYRMPAGVVGRLRLMDAVGREIRSEPTVVGTGEYAEQRLSLVQGPSGVYMVELIDGGERSALPLVITR